MFINALGKVTFICALRLYFIGGGSFFLSLLEQCRAVRTTNVTGANYLNNLFIYFKQFIYIL